MKKVLLALALLCGIVGKALAQNNDTQLEVLMKDGASRSFIVSSVPKATFAGQQMTIAEGGEDWTVRMDDVKSMSYSDKGANVCVFKNTFSNVNIDFDKMSFVPKFNGKQAAIRIEAEDLDLITDMKGAVSEVVSPLPQYAGRVSGSLLHLTPTTRTSNPSVTYGKMHITGKYNIYLATVPGTCVNAEDTINRTRKIRFACTYQVFNSASYSTKTVSYSTNPTNSTEKLMIDHSDIDTLLMARGFTSSSIVLDDTHEGSYKFQSQKMSADDTVNDFYLDFLLFVPVDDEGNELEYSDILTVEKNGFRSYITPDSFEYIEWQKEKIVVDEEVKVPYGNTRQIMYSFTPDFIKYPSIAFESEDPEIASVDVKGVVSGNTIGSTYIVLTDVVGGAKARVKLTVTGTPALAGMPLIVNEVMSGNIDQFVDPSFNYGGWVELYNPTDEDLVLARCYVSDDANDLKKFHLSSRAGSVPAHGYKNLWFDHADFTTDQIPFKLDYNGGTFYLCDAKGDLITKEDYPAMLARCSYARKIDGGDEWGWTGYPTPQKGNAESVFATEQLSDPEVSMQSCVYNGTIDFKVAVPEGAKLFYTTNGSVPNESNSRVSTDGNFTFSSNVAIRFRAFKDGYLPSNVVTRSFFNADSYDNIGVDIRSLPIISIVTDNDNLNSSKIGIFVQGVNGRPGNGHSNNWNTNMDWDRPVDFQYLKGGEYVFSQEVDIETCGGWSRSYGAHSSFKIKADKKYYGLKNLDYAFFDQKPYLKNKTLQIRNGGNDYNARIKDAALQSLVSWSDLDVDCQSYQPVLHYINGKMYGIINMREPNNKHFVYANYGWDSDEIDMFEMGPDSAYCQKCGTKDAYLELYEMTKYAADPVVYQEICDRMDIDEYVNYMAVQLYLCNWDWPQNNMKGFRYRNGGKFRFVLFDLDHSLEGRNPFTSFAGKKNYTFDTVYPEMTKKKAEIEFVTIFENMLENDEFRKKFVDTFCMVGATIFEPSYVNRVTWELVDRVGEIQTLIEGESKSPYKTIYNVQDAFESDAYNSNSRMINYLYDYDDFKLWGSTMLNLGVTSFVENADESTAAPLLYNGMKIPTNRFKGYAFTPITLTAEPIAGKRFEGWYDQENGGLISKDAVYTVPERDFDVSVFAYYSDIPQSDRLGQGVAPVRINEVSAANTVYANEYFKREDWVELYNTTFEPIDLAGMFITDNPEKMEKYQIQADADESTIIPALGYKVIWFDKKSGISQLHAPFRLDDDGDVLYLSSADHSWTDCFVYSAHDGNHTVGRYPDGSDSIYMMSTPTIEKRNIRTSYMSYVGNGKVEPTVIEALHKKERLNMVYQDGALCIDSEYDMEATINLFGADGRKVFNESVVLHSGSNAISIGSLAAGTYIAFLKTEGGGTSSLKFMK